MKYYLPEISDKAFYTLEDALKYAYSKVARSPTRTGVYVCNENRIVGVVFYVSKKIIAYIEEKKIHGKIVQPNGQLCGLYSTPRGISHFIVAEPDASIIARLEYLQEGKE